MKQRNAITSFSRVFSTVCVGPTFAPLYISGMFAVILTGALMVSAILPSTCWSQSEIVLRLPMDTAGPNSLDPVRGSSQYDSRAAEFVYETLLEYEYLKRPYQLKPCLLESMPEVSEDGKTFSFKLRDDIFFQDDPCFPDGKGRKVVTDDVFYSLKRMADTDNQPKSWWLMADTIKGFDDYREQQNAAKNFDYDLPVSGMVKINDSEFQIVLNQPFIRFMYTLAMFQTSVLPREAVDHYGDKFSRHPVGTGPFVLEHWESGLQMIYRRNPNYRDVRYPADPGMNDDGTPPYDGYEEDKALGMYESAGQRLPLADKVILTLFQTRAPMWLKFLNQELDYTRVPAEYFSQAFVKRKRTLRPEFVEKG